MPKIGVSRPRFNVTRAPAPKSAVRPFPVRRLDIDATIPDGLVRSATRELWLLACEQHPDGDRRSDWRRNLLAVAKQLLSRTGTDRVTLPKKGATWSVIAAAANVSRRTLAYLLRWLRERGLLVIVVAGSTCRFRRGTLCGLVDDGLGNRATQYALTMPAATHERLLAASPDSPQSMGTFVARDWREVPWPAETSHVEQSCTPRCHLVSLGEETSPYAGASARPANTTPELTWSATATPGSKRDMLAAAERLRGEDMTLRRLGARHLRSLFRLLFQAGATPSDVRHVLNVSPDGRPWRHTQDQRWLPGWIRWRISAWIDQEGALRAPLPSQVAAVVRTRLLAEQAERNAVWERLRAERAVDVSGHAARARAGLAKTLRRASTSRHPVLHT